MKTPKATAEQVAKMFNVPIANVRRNYADNAKELRQCEAKAKQARSGSYRGATAQDWAEGAEHAEKQSVCVS